MHSASCWVCWVVCWADRFKGGGGDTATHSTPICRPPPSPLSCLPCPPPPSKAHHCYCRDLSKAAAVRRQQFEHVEVKGGVQLPPLLLGGGPNAIYVRDIQQVRAPSGRLLPCCCPGCSCCCGGCSLGVVVVGGCRAATAAVVGGQLGPYHQAGLCCRGRNSMAVYRLVSLVA